MDCTQKAYRRQVSNRYVYDGTTQSSSGTPIGNWVRTRYEYDEGLYRIHKNDPAEFLGYVGVRQLTYQRNSYWNEAKVLEQWFYRNNGHSNTDRAGIAQNPNPRLGRVSFERILQPGTSGCRYPIGSRCQKANTSYSLAALTGGGTNWWGTSDYKARPLWIRQNQVTTWVDGASNTQKFFYESSRQNNTQYGNVTRVEEWTGGTKLRSTETEYFPNTGAHVVNLPARVLIRNASNHCKAESRYIYGAWSGGSNVNNHYRTAPANPLLVKEEVALTGCSGSITVSTHDHSWAVTRYGYDRYGNQTAVNQTGVDGNRNQVILTTYDGIYHRFPIRRYHSKHGAYEETLFYYGVNRSGHDPHITDYRAHWGQIAESCAMNDLCTRYGYDDQGRARYRWDATTTNSSWGNHTPTKANVLWGYNMVGSSGLTRNVVTEWRAPRCYGNFSRKVYNGLGQLIQEQGPQQDWRTNADGCNPGNYYPEVDVSYNYDALGNQDRAGVPVGTTATWVNRGANWGAGYTATSYDVLGRPLVVTAPNGERTEYNHVGRTTSVVAKGRNGEHDKVIKWTQSDALGNLYLARNYRRNSANTGWLFDAQVILHHDVRGNLTRVNYPNGSVATMGYDAAGRKTSMNDPDLGYWRYAYDRQHRLTRQTDARNNTTCLYYGTFGRLAGKHFRTNTSCPGSVSTYDIRYLYDGGHSSSNRSRDQLTQVYYHKSQGYYKNLYYNDKGLLQQEQVRIPGKNAFNTYTYYDDYLRAYATKYPDGEVVKVNFNSQGLPKLMCSAYWNSSHQAYWCNSNPWYVNNASYDAAGRMTQMQFPAGNLWQRRGYYSWKATNGTFAGNGNGRLNYIYTGTQPGWTNRLNLTYYYDSFGNVKQYYDNNGHHGFTYDHQNRLTRAYGRNYSYDTSGRLIHYEGTNQSVNNSFPAHAIKKSGYTYDANGNLKTRYGRTLTWNHENRAQRAPETGHRPQHR